MLLDRVCQKNAKKRPKNDFEKSAQGSKKQLFKINLEKRKNLVNVRTERWKWLKKDDKNMFWKKAKKRLKKISEKIKMKKGMAIEGKKIQKIKKSKKVSKKGPFLVRLLRRGVENSDIKIIPF